MKIGILHERNSGFFPRFYRDLSEAISLSGNDWVLLTPNSGANKRNPLPKQRLYGVRWNWFVHFHLYKLIGLQDIFSSFSTLCLIWALRKEKVDVVFVDPPRKGMSEQGIDDIARLNPQCVVYVSCNPKTLARDIKIFEQEGYRCEYVQPVDLFCQTNGIECVAKLEKMD